MSAQQILILGDSHTRAIKQAHEKRGRRDDHVGFSIHWIERQRGAATRGDLKDADAQAKVRNLQARDMLVISILGTMHNIIGLLQHEVPFEVALPGDESFTLRDGTALLPANALIDWMKGHAERNTSIRRWRDAAACPVFHLPTPPPKADSQFIRERTQRYRDRLVAEAGINAPALRLTLWRLEMQALSEVCAGWGVSLLPAPREAQSPEGFLLSEFYGDDATHANAAYGELVLRQLERIASGHMATAESA